MAEDSPENLSQRIDKLEQQNLQIIGVIKALNKGVRSAYVNMEKILEDCDEDGDTVISEDTKQTVQDELLKLQEDKIDADAAPDEIIEQPAEQIEEEFQDTNEVEAEAPPPESEPAAEEFPTEEKAEIPPAEASNEIVNVQDIIAAELNKPDVLIPTDSKPSAETPAIETAEEETKAPLVENTVEPNSPEPVTTNEAVAATPSPETAKIEEAMTKPEEIQGENNVGQTTEGSATAQ